MWVELVVHGTILHRCPQQVDPELRCNAGHTFALPLAVQSAGSAGARVCSSLVATCASAGERSVGSLLQSLVVAA